MSKTTFYIAQMDCPNEEKLIRTQLNNIHGVQELEFNLIQQTLTITHQSCDLSLIQKKLFAIGMDIEFKNPSYTEKNIAIMQSNLTKYRWMMLGVSGIFALLAEILAFTLFEETAWPVISTALFAMVMGGREVFLKGIRAVRYFTLNMNFLMMIAVTGAIFIGLWAEAAMVTFLFALAETIETYSLDKSRHAIRQLIEMSPDTATVKRKNGGWDIIPVQDIQLNDVIWVKPGERVPLDGKMIKGQSSINQAPITGESMPVAKMIGDLVFAGSINERGSFEFQVITPPNDTLLAKIIVAVQKAQTERAPVQRIVDRFASYYTPIMVMIAILVAAVPPFLLGLPFEPWFYKALVLLVIACPCALVISTPVTVVSGLAAAAKHGVLIKGGAYLEKGHQLKAIAFDKTGTVTIGKPEVTEVIALDTFSKEDILQIAASLESHSEHPVATAILEHWELSKTSTCELSEVLQFENMTGKGVQGQLENQHYFVGNIRLANHHHAWNAELEKHIMPLEAEGKTTMIVGTSQKAIGIIAVTDSIRESSLKAIQNLHKLGITTTMLTGDNAATAGIIARNLGIDHVEANLLPDEKLIAIEALLKQHHHVGMVGDGINDAPALAKASIGFAMGSQGTDVALETADVALMEDNLNKVVFFIRLSRRVWHKLLENISLSIGIKILFFTLALLDLATLWMAIFADMGASLIVILNGLSLLKFQSTKHPKQSA